MRRPSRKTWLTGLLVLGLSGGSAVTAVAATGGFDRPAVVPTQMIRTGPNVANYCIRHGTNTLVYNWSQAPRCPGGTYPLSTTSYPETWTMTFDGLKETCTATASNNAGGETDDVTCR